MSPTSVLPAALIMFVAVVSGWWISRYLRPPMEPGRYGCIDGLRGYLALGVFIHHACVWFPYVRGEAWRLPPSHLYVHLGHSSVTLFFMITGFLFFSKLLDGRTKPIDWLSIFVSRVLRLTPLYLLAMVLMFTVVLVISEGELRDPAHKLLKDGTKWLLFSLLGTPDLNGVAFTRRIVAGVTWSLPYEWLFYLTLPWMATLLRASVSARYLVFSTLCLFVIWLYWTPELVHVVAFLGGMAAALCARSTVMTAIGRSWASSVVVLTSLVLLVVAFPTAYGYPQTLLLSLAFVLIACGASLFGALQARASRALGEITYSVYLLHGLLLFVFFRFVVGYEQASAWNPITYWLCMVALTPVLLTMSTLTYRYVEKPAIDVSKPLTRWLRQHVSGLGRAH
jgi:peptidoglycan/LPS O-acetylase OafA/YrhL